MEIERYYRTDDGVIPESKMPQYARLKFREAEIEREMGELTLD
jgi:cbb3-type cytochrome oxidase cytochrome c subunit